MNQKILLVEDDPNLGLVLKEYLELKGNFEVLLCVNGEEGLKTFFQKEVDICILDVMMPKKDGFTLGKEIRATNSDIPIIFITAKSLMEDKTEAFNLGADDYITKPFRMEELMLRINAILRRKGNGKGLEIVELGYFNLGIFKFNFSNHTLQASENIHKLSSKENELLYLLCSRMNQVLAREEALLKIWKDDNYFNGRSMDVYLSKLRKLLKQDPSIEILNIHGVGYKLLVNP